MGCAQGFRHSTTARRSDAPLRDGPLKFTATDLLRDSRPKCYAMELSQGSPPNNVLSGHAVMVTAFGRLNRRAEGQLATLTEHSLRWIRRREDAMQDHPIDTR